MMASGIVALKDGGEGPAVVRNGRNWSANFVAITAAVMASRSRGCPGRRGGRALPKGAGCCATAWAGSPKPLAQHSCSFDHFVGKGKDLGCDLEAQRAGGVKVDDQLKLRGLLNRNISRVDAFQDLVDVGHYPTEPFRRAGTVGQ